MAQMFSRKDLQWFATQIAPMIYPQDMEEFAKVVKSQI